MPVTEKADHDPSRERKDKKRSHKKKSDKKSKENPSAAGGNFSLSSLMDASKAPGGSTAELAARMDSFLDFSSHPGSAQASQHAQSHAATTSTASTMGAHIPIPPSDMPTYNPPPSAAQYPNYPMPPPPYGMYAPHVSPYYGAAGTSTQPPPSVSSASAHPMRPTPVPYGMPPPPPPHLSQYPGSWPSAPPHHHSMWPHHTPSYDTAAAASAYSVSSAAASYPGASPAVVSAAATPQHPQFPPPHTAEKFQTPPDPFSSHYPGAMNPQYPGAASTGYPGPSTPYATPYTGPPSAVEGLSNDSFLDQLLGTSGAHSMQ